MAGRRSRGSTTATWAAALAACLLSLVPTLAAADEAARERAMATVAEGAKLYAAGDFAGALARYHRAYALFPSPRIHFNIGQAYQGMGKNAQAVTAFERFLGAAADAPATYASEARKQVDRLARKLTLVTVTCDVDGAQVTVDDQAVGETPLRGRVAVEPGAHKLVVAARDVGSQTKPFTGAAGQRLTVKVDLRASNAGATSPSATPLAGAARAEALIREAQELRRAGRDALAYPLLQQAYEIETTPRTAVQLAMVEIQLGYWLLAERHLTEGLAAARDPWIASNRAVIEQSLTRVKSAIGEIVLQDGPAGAEVFVNGKSTGRLPISTPIRLGEGPAHLEVRASGHQPFVHSLNVVGGKRDQIRVTMALASDDPTPGATGSPPAGVADGTDTGRLGKAGRPLAWTAGGLAAGATAFAIYQTVRWHDRYSAFDKRRDCGADEPLMGGPGCSDIHSDFKQARTWAIAGYAAGALLGAGAVTLFIVTPERRPETAIVCAPWASRAGASCRLTF